MDGAADLGAEYLIDETVLLDAAAPLEGGRRDRCAEVVAAAGVVLDVGLGSGNGGLDALLYVLGRRHFHPELSRYTLESDDHHQRQGRREGSRVPRLPGGRRDDGGPASRRAR